MDNHKLFCILCSFVTVLLYQISLATVVAQDDHEKLAHQVSIHNSNGHFCGGTLISKWNVLTAAECCFNSGKKAEPSSLFAVLGHFNLDTKIDGKQHIKSCVVHESFESNTSCNTADLAIATLEIPVDWSKTVAAIELATTAPDDTTECIVSGWGYSNSVEEVRDVGLNKMNVHITKSGLCCGRDGVVCAQYAGADPCIGDYGGPLVCNGTLVGVVSRGKNCLLEGIPGLYMDVAYYRNWIIANMNGATSVDKISVIFSVIAVILHYVR